MNEEESNAAPALAEDPNSGISAEAKPAVAAESNSQASERPQSKETERESADGQAPPMKSRSSVPPGERLLESRERPPKRAESERPPTSNKSEPGALTPLGQDPEPAADDNLGGTSKEQNRDWLVFRMCEVYSAPRLPHVMASEWTPIVHSAEHMKFGVCKFGKMAGVDAKDRERWKKIKTGELKPIAPEKQRRPRVPLAPRRVVARPPQVDVQSEPEPPPAVSPKRSPSGHERWKARREPVECPWCGCLEPPAHPKQCKLRMVECKYCKQQMELGSLRLHFKSCPARPMAQTESRAPKNSSSSSAFTTLHRLQSSAAYSARQLEASMRRLLTKQPQASAPEQVSIRMATLDTHLGLLAEELSALRSFEREEKPSKTQVEDLQKRLYLLQAQVAHVEQMAASWETVLKAGERSKMHCGVSRLQSSVQTVHRQLDELTQQAVEFDMGDPRTDPNYAPAHLEATLEAIREEGTALDRSQQTLIAQGSAPNIDVLSDLQGRLHFFQELLRCVTEAVAKNDHGSTLQSIVRHRPLNQKRGGLPPLSARVESDEKEPVEELMAPPPPPPEAKADLYESSPLPPDRGPAAMGRREMSLEQMKEEIDEERKRYIAYHLMRDDRGGVNALSTSHSMYG